MILLKQKSTYFYNIYAVQQDTQIFNDWVLFNTYFGSTYFGPHRSICRSVSLQAVCAGLVCGNMRTTRHVQPLRSNRWGPKHVELKYVLNKPQSLKTFCILLDCIYITGWYTVLTISGYIFLFTTQNHSRNNIFKTVKNFLTLKPKIKLRKVEDNFCPLHLHLRKSFTIEFCRNLTHHAVVSIQPQEPLLHYYVNGRELNCEWLVLMLTVWNSFHDLWNDILSFKGYYRE